jgi:hypothetical protein
LKGFFKYPFSKVPRVGAENQSIGPLTATSFQSLARLIQQLVGKSMMLKQMLQLSIDVCLACGYFDEPIF